MTEEWRPIPGYDGYHVSNLGRVASTRRGGWYLMAQHMSRDRLVVSLTRDGKQKHVGIHRAIALAFLPRLPHQNFVRHLDDNPLNNDLSNLAWGTPLDNSRDARRNGRNYFLNMTHCIHGHEFTPDNTRIVNGKRRCLICSRARCNASAAKRRQERRAVAGPKAPRTWSVQPLKLPAETVAGVRAAYQPGVRGSGVPALAERFGLTRSTVAAIVKGKGHWGRAA